MEKQNVCVSSWNATLAKGVRAVYPEGSAVTADTLQIAEPNLSEDEAKSFACVAYEILHGKKLPD